LVGDRCYRAHKIVLAATSDVFRVMLFKRKWAEGYKKVVRLCETKECEKAFESFLSYLYTDKIFAADDETLVGLFQLADKYNVESLTSKCQWHLRPYLDESDEHYRTDIPVTTAFYMHPFFRTLNLECLCRCCVGIVSRCFEPQLSSLPEWLDCDFEIPCQVLAKRDLVVKSESVVYEVVSKWLLHGTRRDKLAEYAAILLPLVRFPRINAAQLADVAKSQLATMPECAQDLRAMIESAREFQRNLSTDAYLFSERYNDARYWPRFYTDSLRYVRIRQQPAGDVLTDDAVQGRVTCDVIKADWRWTATNSPYPDALLLTLHCDGGSEKLKELGVEPRIFESDEGVRMHRLYLERIGRVWSASDVTYYFRPRATTCWMTVALARVTAPE
jgi:BTB/POZ domain-containing protein 17